ncbi:MAG: type IV pilus modification protein PilV [Burkholderiales bacterium]
MLEVLVTIVILAFGMLGLAGMQSKMYSAEMESYQRAQALVLLNDMVDRINANRYVAANYTHLTNTLGHYGPLPLQEDTIYGTATDQDCPTKTTPTDPVTGLPYPLGVLRDLCEWSNALKGAAETSGTAKVGGMVGAVGCITQIQAQNTAAGVCTPGIYLVSVAWQGVNATTVPAASCGQGLFGSDDRLRRVISARVSIGLPSCQ